MQCLKCAVSFESRDKRRKFCSQSCSASFNNKLKLRSQLSKDKASASLKIWHYENRNHYVYNCEKCNIAIESHKQKRIDRKAHCQACKRKVPKHKKYVNSLLDISKRTVSKIIKRMGLTCFNCGWGECVGDLHHIVPRSKGGDNAHSNLTYLCPNCHRKAHNKMIDLFVTVENQLGDSWKKFYF